MNNNRNGFTLAEIMLSMAIIGIIMAISINSIKIVKTSYTSLAYFAHKTILEMVTALYSGTITSVIGEKKTCDATHCYMQGKKYKDKKCSLEKYKDSPECVNDVKVYYQTKYGTEDLRLGNEFLKPMVTRCKNSQGVIVNVLKNDNELNSSVVSCNNRVTANVNANLFCKSLVAISNNSGKYNCSSLNLPEIVDGEPTFNFAYSSPNFTLTNGMRYYISAWDKNDAVSPDYGYRIVAVDLNGKQGPNRQFDEAHRHSSRPTDTVSFLVLDNGEVYPLGVAADNLKLSEKRTVQYLNAKVKGYYFNDKKDRQSDIIPGECCKSNNGAKDCSTKYCNFGVVSLVHRVDDKEIANFTYRDALCTAKKRAGISYIKYCSESSLAQNKFCPPADKSELSDTIYPFDTCKVETIKPMFRYNF